MDEERQGRSRRLQERLADQRAKEARPAVVDAVRRATGEAPSLDHFLSRDATEALVAASLAIEKSAARSTWTADLSEEAVAAAIGVANELGSLEAFWLHERVAIAGAVLVPAGPVLRWGVEQFRRGAYDVWLVTAHADDGVRFGWDYLPEPGAFELLRWGAVAAR